MPRDRQKQKPIAYSLDFSQGFRGQVREKTNAIQWLNRNDNKVNARYMIHHGFRPNRAVADELIQLQKKSALYTCDWAMFDFSRVIARLTVGLHTWASTGKIDCTTLRGGRAVSVTSISAVERTSAVGIGNIFLPNTVDSMTTPHALTALIHACNGAGARVIVETAVYRVDNNNITVPVAEDAELALGMVSALELLHANYIAHGCVDLFFAAVSVGQAVCGAASSGNHELWQSYLRSVEFQAPVGGISSNVPHSHTLAWPDGSRPSCARFVDSLLLLHAAAVTVSDEGVVYAGDRYPTLIPALPSGQMCYAASARHIIAEHITRVTVNYTALCGHPQQQASARLSALSSFVRATTNTVQYAVESDAAFWCVEPTGIMLRPAHIQGLTKPMATYGAVTQWGFWGENKSLLADAGGTYAVNMQYTLWRECAASWWVNQADASLYRVASLASRTRVGWGAASSSAPAMLFDDVVTFGVDAGRCVAPSGVRIAVKATTVSADGWTVTLSNALSAKNHGASVGMWISLLTPAGDKVPVDVFTRSSGTVAENMSARVGPTVAQELCSFGDFVEMVAPIQITRSAALAMDEEDSEDEDTVGRDELGNYIITEERELPDPDETHVPQFEGTIIATEGIATLARSPLESSAAVPADQIVHRRPDVDAGPANPPGRLASHSGPRPARDNAPRVAGGGTVVSAPQQ